MNSGTVGHALNGWHPHHGFQAKAIVKTIDSPIKMTKLVRKNPIQTHVMTGTFWGQET